MTRQHGVKIVDGVKLRIGSFRTQLRSGGVKEYSPRILFHVVVALADVVHFLVQMTRNDAEREGH